MDKHFIFNITVDKLRVRSKPGLKGKTIENLEIGSKEYTGGRSMKSFTVKIKGQNREDYWYSVKTPSGKNGWIHMLLQ